MARQHILKLSGKTSCRTFLSAVSMLFSLIAQASDHWAFQPVSRPAVPEVRHKEWPSNPIDAFVLAKLETRGWRPAARAEGSALLRRAWLDLLGIPPPLAAQQAWAGSPRDWARVIDDLLARPGHGERWARHWLDLVRYAETNGYERDAIKPFVWRYRDYIIHALNADKTYDRFLREQLAGDELADRSAETMIATGFYRLGHWDDEPADPLTDRFDQLDDILNTTSQSILGLSLACARCHDHKFEPLTMKDYYSLLAVFDPLERPRAGRRELTLPAGSRAEIAEREERDRRIGELQAEETKLRNASIGRFLASGKTGLPQPILDAFALKAEKRNAGQKKRVAENQERFAAAHAAWASPDFKNGMARIAVELRTLRERTPDLPEGYFMREKSPKPPVTHVLVRGQATRPGERVQPAAPAALTGPALAPSKPDQYTTRRRLELARWITSRDNPLTARVIVNHVWRHHFGEGLVRGGDFGTAGPKPTHPELLDWLSHWFMHEADWSLKKLHRLIMTSSTWRMSRARNEEYATVDPDNLLLWRAPYRRLEAEAIRDSMLAVSGRLNRRIGGPSMYPSVPPQALEGHSDPEQIWKPLDEEDASRRTVYAFIKRSMVVPMLETLDLCDTTRPSTGRMTTTVAPQALTLYNGEFVNRQARHFAARLQRKAGDEPAKQIEQAFQLALCREPSETEVSAALDFLVRESNNALNSKQQALTQLCRVILNLNEFVYPE